MPSSVVGAKAMPPIEHTAQESVQRIFAQIPILFTESYHHEVSHLKQLAQAVEDVSDHKAYAGVANALIGAESALLSDITITFSRALKDTHKAQALAEEQALNFHTNHLSIVTDKELVYQLKLEAGFAHSRNTFERVLVQSGWKFFKKAESTEIHRQLDAIRPGVLALILQAAIDTQIEDKQVARIAYRFVAGHFFSALQDQYDGLTKPLQALIGELTEAERLTHFGNYIPLPEVEEFEHRENTAKPHTTNIDVTGLLKNWDVPASLTPGQENAFEGFSEISLEQLSADTQIRTASVQDVVHLLRRLSDSTLNDDSAGMDKQDIRSALKQGLSQLSGEGILTVVDRVSENVLNLVSHLFENLNQQGMLIDELTTQISRLEVPVMQVALTDSQLFQTPEHPVRKYLNSIGDLGQRISNADEEGYLEIRDSISTILKEYDGDIQCFSAQQQAMNDYMDHSIYCVKHADGEFEAHDYQKARKFVPISDFLDSQSHLLKNELQFHKLLKYVWGAIMACIIRRHGTDSLAWNAATEIYSSALWSTQVPASPDGKREILRRLPSIVQGVRQLFTEYGLDKRIRDTLLDQMIQLHLQIMRGVDGTQLRDSNTVSLDLFRLFKGRILIEPESGYETENSGLEFSESESLPEPLQNVYSRFDAISPFDGKSAAQEEIDWGAINDADNQMIQKIREQRDAADLSGQLERLFVRLNQLPLESVVQIEQDDHWRRFRLADKSVTLGRFTLKAFDGGQTLVKTKAELALMISRNKAKLTQELSLFDQALESVVARIQNH